LTAVNHILKGKESQSSYMFMHVFFDFRNENRWKMIQSPISVLLNRRNKYFDSIEQKISWMW